MKFLGRLLNRTVTVYAIYRGTVNGVKIAVKEGLR